MSLGEFESAKADVARMPISRGNVLKAMMLGSLRHRLESCREVGSPAHRSKGLGGADTGLASWPVPCAGAIMS